MKRLLLALAFASALTAQTTSSIARHIRYGPSLPATCSPATGDVFYKTTATIQPYYCSAPNTWTAIGGGGGGGDFSTNTSTSVDSEFVLFSGTGGKTGKRATGTGIARSASGVYSASELSGDVVTSGSNAATVVRLNGASVPASASVLGSNGSSQLIADTATEINAPLFCADAGSTDTYACNLAPAITSYVTGTHYRFKANTANTGTASINFNSKGALTLVKAAGGITTTLADNDIRAGQWIDCVYDGTNCQMQSTLGNAASGGGTFYQTVQTAGPGGAQSAATDQTQQTKLLFQYPLKVDSSNPNAVSVVAACDPRKLVCEFDDFAGIVPDPSYINSQTIFSTLIWQNNPALCVSQPLSPAGTYGVIDLTTGDTITNNCSTANTQAQQFDNTTFDIQIRAGLSSTDNISFFVGVTDNTAVGEAATNYIGVGYDTSLGTPDTNYMCVSKGSTSSRTSIGTAANTSQHTFRIRSTTAGTIACSVDGGTEVTITGTNIPTAQLNRHFAVTTKANNAKTLTVDFWQLVYAISR